MTPAELSRTVLHAVRRAVVADEIRLVGAGPPERVLVERPRPGGRGDYATGIALQLAGSVAGRSALDVARVLRERLVRADGIAGVDITGPGFLNITLGGDPGTALVAEILRDGLRYGYGDSLAGQPPLVLRAAPGEIRAELVAQVLVGIIRSQGGAVESDGWVADGGSSVSGGPPLAGRPSAVRDTHGHAWESPADRPPEAVTADRSPVAPVAPVAQVRPVPPDGDPRSLGPDACRWVLLSPAAHDRPRIGPDVLAQRAENPLFRVRYAYSRTRALTRNARDLGFEASPGPVAADLVPAPVAAGPPPGPSAAPTPRPAAADPASGPVAAGHTPGSVTNRHTPGRSPVQQLAPLPPSPEADLLGALGDHPLALRAAAAHRAPDRLARHLVRVADTFLLFHDQCGGVLPSGDEKPLAAHRARLALAEAAGTVLAGGLSLLGISAPEFL
ncbi:ArgS-related anticodon-binding protein NrtL [Streptomyces tsukubensis]|uniref:arginine--tRNA ligase n=1 Tax=Streptomyces tsukubensis TaxID=83656 RepID=A0A1V4A0H6_9ACTN|nr:DALR anticodon-binding domain-containing protein [Streptomyces tsukubensis]OON71974.1 hypothetical protein B1H18_31440 [Streptomyces tsukubensis]